MTASETSVRTCQLPATSTTDLLLSQLHSRSRRRVTLYVITALLQLLLWTSVGCIATVIVEAATDPHDASTIPSLILLIVSSVATLAYVALHTFFSIQQNDSKVPTRNNVRARKTSYIAVRAAVSLCVLWLLTAGWSMILLARRPLCLPQSSSVRSWEAGAPCQVNRVSIALVVVALLSSLTLFWLLATVRRPFESHLFRSNHVTVSSYSQGQSAIPPKHTPAIIANMAGEKHDSNCVDSTPHTDQASTLMASIVDATHHRGTSPPASICAPSPKRIIGLGIYNSDIQLSNAPADSEGSSRTPSPAKSTISPASLNTSHHLMPPPALSRLVQPAALLPLTVPAHYSASALRAVYPPGRSPLGPAPSRSQPQLSRAYMEHGFTYRRHMSRSSASLTRPQRLSSLGAPSAGSTQSSKSSSAGHEDGRGSPSCSSGAERRSTTDDKPNIERLAPVLTEIRNKKTFAMGHARHASAPDTSYGAQRSNTRSSIRLHKQKSVPQIPLDKIKEDLALAPLSGFSPDTSPDDDAIDFRKVLEKELTGKPGITDASPIAMVQAADPLRVDDVPPEPTIGEDTSKSNVVAISASPDA